MLDDAQALAVGQAHVGEAQVERLLVEQPDRLGDRFGAGRVEPHARQRELEQLEQVGLVVDDEHSGLAADFAGHGSLPLMSTLRGLGNARFMRHAEMRARVRWARAPARRRWRRRARARCTGRARCRRAAS